MIHLIENDPSDRKPVELVNVYIVEYDGAEAFTSGENINVVVDALSQKESVKPIRVRAIRIDITTTLMVDLKEFQRKTLENEAHKSKYLIHPGKTKMYHDLKLLYWWPGVKNKSIEYYVERCLTCLQVKVKYQKPYGKLQPLDIPIWKWDHITMDFVTKLPRTRKGYNAI
ncbi:putative nucleotidyltransferase, ribonuclease H [Tanacetum coccineum]